MLLRPRRPSAVLSPPDTCNAAAIGLNRDHLRRDATDAVSTASMSLAKFGRSGQVGLSRDVTVLITAAQAATDDIDTYLMEKSARGSNIDNPFNIIVQCKVLFSLHGAISNSYQ